MTTTEIPTVEMAISLVRRMPPREQARLLVLIAQDIAAAAAPVAAPAIDSWAALFATMDAIAATPQLVAGRSATLEVTESRR